MTELGTITRRFAHHWHTAAPVRLYRQVVYWGVVVIACAITALTVYHLQAIPTTLIARIDGQLDQRTWVRDLVVVDGRDVYLRGEVEPHSGLETEIDLIRQVPGVKRIINRLQDIPKPAAHLKLIRDHNTIEMSGQLSGEILEAVVSAMEQGFPDQRLNDQIQIDDRLGRPLWIHGFEQSLGNLDQLSAFELDGWRNKLVLHGLVESADKVRQIGYSFPASLIPGVTLENRLRTGVAADQPWISLISDWSGTRLSGSVPNRQIEQLFTQAAIESFGKQSIDINLAVDTALTSKGELGKLVRLMPALGSIRDLRLESSGEGYIVWGRVDNAVQLGYLLQTINELSLSALITSEVFISAAGDSATLSVFSDRQTATITGTLPTYKTREALIEQLRLAHGVTRVRDFTSVEPNIEFNDWIEKWPQLLAALPPNVLGVTIDNRSLLLTGNVDNDTDWRIIDLDVARLFPDKQRLNWIKATNTN